MATIEEDREAVRRLFLQADEPGDDEEATRANAAIAAAVEIADRWAESSQLVDLLTPLLADSEKDWTRYSAAAVLLNRGHADLAIPTLETVDIFEAEVVLRRWRKQHQGTA
jgi:hypothetical protein